MFLLRVVREGLWWLVKQENRGSSCLRKRPEEQGIIDLTGDNAAFIEREQPELHPLWKKYMFPDGTPFYYNDFTGIFAFSF